MVVNFTYLAVTLALTMCQVLNIHYVITTINSSDLPHNLKTVQSSLSTDEGANAQRCLLTYQWDRIQVKIICFQDHALLYAAFAKP